MINFILLYLIKFRKRFFLTFFFGVVSSLSLPLVSYSVKFLIDKINELNHDISFSNLMNELGQLILILLITIISQRISGFLGSELISQVKFLIRKDMYKKVLSFPILFFEKHKFGEISFKTNEIPDQVNRLINIILFSVFPLLINILIKIFLLTYINIFFGITVLLWAISHSFFVYKFSASMIKKSEDYAKIQSQIPNYVSDIIKNIHTIKHLATEKYEIDSLQPSLDEELKKNKKMLFFIEFHRTVQNILSFLLVIILLITSIYLLKSLKITVGDFAVIFSLSYALINNVEILSYNALDFYQASGRVKNALKLIQYNDEDNTQLVLNKIFINSTNIEFQNVNFSYDNNIKVFNNLNLSILSQQKIGIIGYSGSGKTTLINLLVGKNVIQSGKIIIGNTIAQREILNQFRKNIGLINQNTVLFNRSIRENIKYANQDASDQYMFEAAIMTNIHNFVINTKHGYDSIIGKDGFELSSGQKQRILLARIFLQDPKILILDEALSNLDLVNQDIIIKNLNNFFSSRTSIIITHNPLIAAKMDKIFFIHAGSIAEKGNHKELLALKSRYYNLWQLYNSPCT